MDRRVFLHGTAAGAAALAMGRHARLLEGSPKDDVIAKIAGQHEQTVKMLQDWIALPSIAAENRNYPQGPEYMAKLVRDAGFDHVEVVPTAGKSGVFATLDAGAKTWLAVYMMYDVKQFDPAEWSSPPLEARVVDRPGVGKIMVGRGAPNSKGPEMACLAALHAFKGAEVKAALRKCLGIIIPLGNQGLDGAVEVDLGAKGVVELELVSSGEKWGRGPKLDIHSSLAAQIDSPAWHLVQALNTLVKADGHTPAVEGFFDKVRPLTAAQRKILEDAIPKK